MNQPSPANITPGTTPGATPAGATPNGVPRAKPRTKPQKPADPFMRRKPPPRRREASPEERGRRGKPLHRNDEYMRAQDGAVANSALVSVNAAIPIVDSSSGILSSGFTTAAPGNFRDYPVIITKGQLKEKLRHHAARFYTKQNVNPTNQEEWTRPVRLHRRDPRNTLPGQKPEEPDAKDLQMEEDREKQEMLKAQRKIQRAIDMAQVAPSLTGQQKKVNKDHNKFVEVRRKDETEAKRAASQLSYEEALPWHFEDDESRQIWVGTYEAALSEAYAQFAIKGDKVYLKPLEKWYKFTQQRSFKSQEELEAFEAKRNNLDPKFMREWAEKQEVIKAEKKLQEAASKLWQVGGKRTANFNSVTSRAKPDREDADEIDFDEDIADDEEDPVYEGDVEETKETQKRIKKDQLKANVFNMKDEGTYDEEEAAEELERALRKQLGKSTNKLLIKQENNRLYATDSDESDSEEEQDSAVKKEDADKTDAEKQKLVSDTSTKGTNTPSGRKEKHRGIRSHDQSEASGNESTRMKQRKNGISSNHASGVNTPNGATPRSLSPGPNAGGLRPPVQRSGSIRPNDLKRSRVGGAGSGSDGEGAGSGGEMSDASRKRIKLRGSVPGSSNVSPGGSRATSPARDSTAQSARPVAPPPTIEQIKASVPEGGMSMKDFTSKWRSFLQSNKENMKQLKGNLKVEKRGDITWVMPIP